VAVLTGYRAAEIAKHTFEIHQVMELHRKLGVATLILASFVLAWRFWKRDQLSRPIRVLTMLFMMAMAGTLAFGAHLGGRLVYEFGVGGTFGKSSPPADHEHGHQH
jgi:uncharacterized membrane protein